MDEYFYSNIRSIRFTPVTMLRTLTRCHRKFSLLSGTCRLLVGKFRSWTAPMVCSRQSIGWGGLWRSCCPSCQIFGAVRFEPKRSFLGSPRERRCSCAVDFWHIVVKPRRRKTTRTYYRFGSRAGTTNCDASGLGGFVRRYLSTRNLGG